MNQHTADTTPEGASEANAAFLSAAAKGNLEEVKKHIDAGANVNGADKNGWTALMLAAFNGHTDIAALLVQKGVDIEAAPQEGWHAGWTALMRAAEAGDAGGDGGDQ